MHRLLKDDGPKQKGHLKKLNQNIVENKIDRTLSEFCNSYKKKFDVICLNFRAPCSNSFFLTIPEIAKIMANKGIIHFVFSVGRTRVTGNLPRGTAQIVVDNVIAESIKLLLKQKKIIAKLSSPAYNYNKINNTPITTYVFQWKRI
jgi:hypothetical protein